MESGYLGDKVIKVKVIKGHEGFFNQLKVLYNLPWKSPMLKGQFMG